MYEALGSVPGTATSLTPLNFNKMGCFDYNLNTINTFGSRAPSVFLFNLCLIVFQMHIY